MGDFDSLTDPTAPGATVGVDEMWAALRDVAGGGMPRDSGAVGDAAATTGLRWGIIDSDVNVLALPRDVINGGPLPDYVVTTTLRPRTDEFANSDEDAWNKLKEYVAACEKEDWTPKPDSFYAMGRILRTNVIRYNCVARGVVFRTAVEDGFFDKITLSDWKWVYCFELDCYLSPQVCNNYKRAIAAWKRRNMSVFCVELIERAIDSMENNFGMLDVTDDVKERWIKQILQADAAKREWFGDLNLDRRDEFSEWQYHRELDCWLSPKMCKLAPAVAQLKIPAVAQLKAVDATPRDLSAGVDDSDDVVMALRNVLKMQISDRVSLPRKLVY